jgi:hypothetical protein
MAGCLLCAVLVGSLPLKIICVGFSLSPISSWNGEAAIDNFKNLLSLCTSFSCTRANLLPYTILCPQSWSTLKSQSFLSLESISYIRILAW